MERIEKYWREKRTRRNPDGSIEITTKRVRFPSSYEPEVEPPPSVVEDIMGLPDSIRRRMGLPPRRRP